MYNQTSTGKTLTMLTFIIVVAIGVAAYIYREDIKTFVKSFKKD